MFSEELEKIDWEETTKTIYSKTEVMCSALLARNIAMWTTLWRSSPPQQQNTWSRWRN